jgi:hypothetical protein
VEADGACREEIGKISPMWTLRARDRARCNQKFCPGDRCRNAAWRTAHLRPARCIKRSVRLSREEARAARELAGAFTL